jgi:GR25 family glycosyltransferase involved in LPS biosynthesis
MNRCVVIHLDSATDRLPLIDKLRTTLIHTLDVYPAKDGTEWEKSSKIAKKHPIEKMPITRGMLGCAHSHIDILFASVKAKEQFCLIFEDDCEVLGTQDDIYGFLHRASHLSTDWDMIILGANEYVESSIAEGGVYTRVQRFWGTHAVILKPKAMRAALKVFADAQKNGVFLPADWMYNEAIKQEGLVCYGPTKINLLCRQKSGLVSAVTGNKRS